MDTQPKAHLSMVRMPPKVDTAKTRAKQTLEYAVAPIPKRSATTRDMATPVLSISLPTPQKRKIFVKECAAE